TIIGDAVDVRHADGTVDQQVFAINVIARPADIPTMIEVDISKLNIGENIKVGDVILPPGVEHGSDLEMAIVTANSARAVVEASTEGEDAAEAAATAAAAPEAAASAE
ncbi:MAG: 50S ribosomal protein L25, partial [Actinobacteria bacterium]|nr:50S ribosomal protein L25 [Actinomycetota bacterium]